MCNQMLSCIKRCSTVDISIDCYHNKQFPKKACSKKAKVRSVKNEFGCTNTSEQPRIPTASKEIVGNSGNTYTDMT